jgi:FlaA1/EpsC-like NDP-sugar epimerase
MMPGQSSLSDRILDLPRAVKRIIAIAVDVVLCLVTVALAYRLRLDEWIMPSGNQWWSYGAAIFLSIPIFIRFGLYRAIFRYVGWNALFSVVRACALYGAIYALIFSAVGIPLIPRSTGILHPILLFLAVGASRAAARYWLGGGYANLLGLGKRRRVLIYGAGAAGRQLAAGLANSGEMQVFGFIDDDTTLQGNLLNGKNIYPRSKMVELIEDGNVVDVLLAIPSASQQTRNDIIESLRGHAVSVRTLPGIFDLADGKVTVSDLRPLDIEDLLGRDPVPPDVALMGRCITGKCVMVTGAGGSIGSELCRQIVAHRPSVLVLVELNEFNLYTINQELVNFLSTQTFAMKLIPLLGSVQNVNRMDAILGEWKPNTIYHAAAFKHVPLVEQNPAEGVRNNILGTNNMVMLAGKHAVRDFVLISTDKAVRPTNVMGATKRMAEMTLQVAAAEKPTTRYSMVRFGNVLGSSGSVVPLFRKQLAAGGPLTVTHTDITRYFMTIPEAAQLVIQAGGLAKGGEVFVLDMGEPVKIIDLARRMIELSGFQLRDAQNPEGDIAIDVVGLRPAEKLFEELLIGDNPQQTDHPRIFQATDMHLEKAELLEMLEMLEQTSLTSDGDAVRALLKRAVPEYIETSEANGLTE